VSAQPAVDPGRENHPPAPDDLGPVPGDGVPAPALDWDLEEVLEEVIAWLEKDRDHFLPPGYAGMLIREAEAAAREAERAAEAVPDWGLPVVSLPEDAAGLKDVIAGASDSEVVGTIQFTHRAGLRAKARWLSAIADLLRLRTSRDLPPKELAGAVSRPGPAHGPRCP
jgi:hypothetical protein